MHIYYMYTKGAILCTVSRLAYFSNAFDMRFPVGLYDTTRYIMHAVYCYRNSSMYLLVLVLFVQISQLQKKISDMDTTVNKQEIEASELKVKELEQKLDIEKSSNKRQEVCLKSLIISTSLLLVDCHRSAEESA